MPWDADRASLYRVIFPQMTNALPSPLQGEGRACRSHGISSLATCVLQTPSSP
jgi:hypothetical protein